MAFPTGQIYVTFIQTQVKYCNSDVAFNEDDFVNVSIEKKKIDIANKMTKISFSDLF